MNMGIPSTACYNEPVSSKKYAFIVCVDVDEYMACNVPTSLGAGMKKIGGLCCAGLS